MRIILSFLLLFLISGAVFSQSPRIARFSISPTNDNKVVVNWTMSIGSTCPTVEVQRSLDGQDFESIYFYPSVCGSSDKEESYNWVDANPIKYAVNYYRIKLEESEFTLSSSVDLQSNLANRQILTYPNPTAGTTQVELRNEKSQFFDLFVFDAKGNVVVEKANQKGTELSLDLSSLGDGIYFLQFRFENGDKTSSPILIMR